MFGCVVPENSSIKGAVWVLLSKTVPSTTLWYPSNLTDVIVISYTYNPVSWTFEMSEDKTRIIEVTSENSFLKNN